MTKFKAGKSGNPAGRPKGARNKTLVALDKILDDEGQTLLQKAVELGKEGDIQALKLCLDRVMPVRKDTPISFKLPKINGAEDLPKVTGAILKAVSNGSLTPSEGQALSGILEKHRSAVETADLQKQLNELKESLGV